MAPGEEVQEKIGKLIGQTKNGPSRWELMLGLFDNSCRRKVYFTFREAPADITSKRVKAVITRAGKAFSPVKGSSERPIIIEKWIIDGYILGTSISFTGVYFPETRYGELFYAKDWRHDK